MNYISVEFPFSEACYNPQEKTIAELREAVELAEGIYGQKSQTHPRTAPELLADWMFLGIVLADVREYYKRNRGWPKDWRDAHLGFPLKPQQASYTVKLTESPLFGLIHIWRRHLILHGIQSPTQIGTAYRRGVFSFSHYNAFDRSASRRYPCLLEYRRDPYDDPDLVPPSMEPRTMRRVGRGATSVSVSNYPISRHSGAR